MGRNHCIFLFLSGAASLVFAALLRDAARRPSASVRDPAPGEATGTDRMAPAPAALAPLVSISVDDPEELRALVARCRSAGADEARDLEATALSAEDPLVAGNALRALGRMGLVGTSSAAAELIGDPRPRIRQEAILALGRSRDPGAIDALATLLEDEDETLRRLAIRALGEIGDERARAHLEALLETPGSSETDRAFARSALAARSSGRQRGALSTGDRG